MLPIRRLAAFPKPHTRLSYAWIHNSAPRMLFNKQPTPQTPAPENKKQIDHKAFDKHPILSKVPRFLRPWTTQFIHAPVSHVTAFLVLHELTAIVPLVGIWYMLHSYHDLLMVSSLDLPSWAIEKGTKIIDSAMESFDWGNYSLNEKVQIIMEGAYAYVIVKALFPVRLAFSLLGMPWFAKWFVLPITRLFSRKRKTPTPPVEAPKAPTQHKVKKIEKPRL
ncbi:hypothetical protein CA3LBN_002170 [Candidozyma haemuli]|uniref:DUF1279 domain-containing protein n=1 Tax=Candidozyma haemuli TaxID=45357 RepID=A0ABX8I7Q4_9ASCO|nr:hypothetical protein CA3LBN_002170 [[Candida] haemuloni]